MQEDYTLQNTDPEDIEDLLIKVETSFDIKFVENELAHIKTFGEMCDHITNKIQLESFNDCTTQQAFYKLRDGIAAISSYKNLDLKIDTKLFNVFPRKSRKMQIQELEEHLDMKLNLLSPPSWVTITLVILLFGSIGMLFFKFLWGVSGVLISMIGFNISAKIGNELDIQTIGELAQKITRDNYLKTRRKPNTFNRNEIENILRDLFAKELCLDKSTLTRDATFA